MAEMGTWGAGSKAEDTKKSNPAGSEKKLHQLGDSLMHGRWSLRTRAAQPQHYPSSQTDMLFVLTSTSTSFPKCSVHQQPELSLLHTRKYCLTSPPESSTYPSQICPSPAKIYCTSEKREPREEALSVLQPLLPASFLTPKRAVFHPL